MAVPKKRHTPGRRNQRRAHHKLKLVAVSRCSHCKRVAMSHRMCPHCGYYKGREVVDVLAKLTKRERKQREKQEKERLAAQQRAEAEAQAVP